MIDIRPLNHFDPAAFTAIAAGYTTNEIYRVAWTESDAQTTFNLTLERLPGPKRFHFPVSTDDMEHYKSLVPNDYCIGAYHGDTLAGIALGELSEWNRTLRVWEFHVAEAYQRQGIGRRLMAVLADRAKAAGLRALVLETQNTNIPAIRFYRATGFSLEAVDISFYTNEDMAPDGTVAVFMKLRLV